MAVAHQRVHLTIKGNMQQVERIRQPGGDEEAVSVCCLGYRLKVSPSWLE